MAFAALFSLPALLAVTRGHSEPHSLLGPPPSPAGSASRFLGTFPSCLQLRATLRGAGRAHLTLGPGPLPFSLGNFGSECHKAKDRAPGVQFLPFGHGLFCGWLGAQFETCRH